MNPEVRVGACLALLLPIVSASCSVNPATGQRQLSLISEQQEIALGRETNQQILDTMPVYADAAVQDYVSRIGRDLARRTERPDLPWTFVVLDDPAVNAFAIPGGHVYITRGILGYMNSEAELASVLGHEIGHVTARHSVEQMSKQQLLGLGLGIGAIVSPEFARYQELAKTGAGLLLLKYSRADEAQADELGLRYMVDGGYDGREMPKVFRTLERVSEAAPDGQRLPNWLSTHPSPGNRFATISADVARLGTRAQGRVERATYLAHVDGMVFGADPRQGFFRGEHFFHPELRFRIDFPAGWKTSNEVQRVVAIAPDQDALVQMTISDESTTDAALRAFAGQEGISAQASRSYSSHGLDGVQAEFSAESQGKALRGQVVYVSYRQKIYQLLALGTTAQWDARSEAAKAALHSFRPLTEARYLEVSPARIEVVNVSRPTTLEAFARETESTAPVATLAIVNEIEPGASLQPGQQAKTITGGALPD